MSNLLNMTEVPEVIGTILNVPSEVAGIAITIVLTACLVIFLAIIKAPELATAGLTVASFGFFTFLEWFPIWVTILIALVVSLLFGKEAVSMLKGGG